MYQQLLERLSSEDQIHGVLQKEEEKILLALESAAQRSCDQLMDIAEQLKQQILVSE